MLCLPELEFTTQVFVSAHKGGQTGAVCTTSSTSITLLPATVGVLRELITDNKGNFQDQSNIVVLTKQIKVEKGWLLLCSHCG